MSRRWLLCGHCDRPSAAPAPLVEAHCEHCGRRLLAARVDVAAHPALARRHHIRAVPTFLLFRRGRAVARLDGAPTTARLTSWLEPQL